ncbi:PREDICTED: uncharacterized protein C14orf80 homolog [Priapulus caudatus]|uniref:Uncharacterized protein C14orf80 homolog n=1 Tax=Priapulus caudatus TaxID=37621 RepID=A0ABM1F5R5_PRICU|nr:PREDICTED: uncharacterized protein C14orf80 homolog [Priapulus caudatus]
MSQIREVVEILCKCLIHCISAYGITAEILRKAMRNRADVVPDMWLALLDVLEDSTKQTTFYKGDLPLQQLRSQHRLSRRLDSNVINSVKSSFLKLGYNLNEFHSLPGDGTQGSRELLLALAWYLGRMKPLDKYIIRCTSDIIHITNIISEDTTGVIELGTCGSKETDRNIEHVNDGSVEERSAIEHYYRLSVKDKANYYAWLYGKVLFSIRSLHAIHSEQTKLMHRVHCGTAGVHVTDYASHLSVLHAYLLDKPKQLSRYLETIRFKNSLMALLLKWKASEGIFWRWIASIVDDKKMGRTSIKCTNVAVHGSLEKKSIQAPETTAGHGCSGDADVNTIEQEKSSRNLVREQLLKSTKNLLLSEYVYTMPPNPCTQVDRANAVRDKPHVHDTQEYMMLVKARSMLLEESYKKALDVKKVLEQNCKFTGFIKLDYTHSH